MEKPIPLWPPSAARAWEKKWVFLTELLLGREREQAASCQVALSNQQNRYGRGATAPERSSHGGRAKFGR